MQKSNYLEFLTEWFIEAHISHLAPKSRIRVDDLDADDAYAFAKMLITKTQASKDNSGVTIAVLNANADSNDPILISFDGATWLRNRESQLVLVVPHTLAGLVDSVGLGVFNGVSVASMLPMVIDHAVSAHFQDEKAIKLAQIFSRVKSRTSAYGRLRYLAAVHELEEPFWGLQLHNLGLIPDAGSDFIERLEKNWRACDAAFGKQKPLSDPRARLTELGLEDGPLFEDIVRSLSSSSNDLEKWLEQLSSRSLTFDLWRIDNASRAEINKVEFAPFHDAEGNVDPSSRLVEHPITYDLIAQEKVSVKWTIEPERAQSPQFWELRVVPLGDAEGPDSAELCFKRVPGNRRSQLLTWTFDSENADLNLAYEVVITAIDERGSALLNEEGSVVSASSGMFFNSEAENTDVENKDKSERNIHIARLRRVYENRSSKDHVRALWDQVEAKYRFAFSAGDWISSPASPILFQLQQRTFENDSLLGFQAQGVLGSDELASSLKQFEIDVPKELIDARRKLFDLLRTATKGDFVSVESCSWNARAQKAVESYVKTYTALLEGSDPTTRHALLNIDTLTLQVEAELETVSAVVVLPTHPLRLIWIAKYSEALDDLATRLDGVSAAKRQSLMDWELVEKVDASNLPFVAVSADHLAHEYHEELVFGVGLYLSEETRNVDTATLAIRSALGLSPDRRTKSGLAKLAHQRVERYQNSHESRNGLKIATVNAGDGDFAAALVKLASGSESWIGEKKFHVVAFADNQSRVNPLSSLRSVSIADLGLPLDLNPSGFMGSPLEIESRPLGDLLTYRSNFHLATFHNLAVPQRLETTDSSSQVPYLGGLITRIKTAPAAGDHSTYLLSLPSVESSNEAQSRNLIAAAHRAYLENLAQQLTGRRGMLARAYRVPTNLQDSLSKLHEICDWVITVDKAIGLAALEAEGSKAFSGGVVIDYAPDFVDGVGERITVTTSKSQEIEMVISQAMSKLKLADDGVTSRDILRQLGSVSGQLALRLLSDDTQAQESVGLAAVMYFLENRGSLENTIVIPVDSHLEIFGRKNQASLMATTAKRCDVILVRFRNNNLEYELLEVKARTGSFEAQLPSTMAEQVSRTESVIEDMLYSPSVRVDHTLQWARWASILEFYANRAFAQGRFSEQTLELAIESIRRLEAGKSLQHRIKKSGYIVCIDGGHSQNVKAPEGLHLEVLDAEKLQATGFTTLAH